MGGIGIIPLYYIGQPGNCAVKTRSQERMEMLQRYKTEKDLRKLKEQREKPVFRVGRFKPEIPAFLPSASQIPVLSKPKEKVRRASIVFECCLRVLAILCSHAVSLSTLFV